VALRKGDLAKARVLGERAVGVARAYGLGRELGISLQVLDTVQLQQRELDAAAATIAAAGSHTGAVDVYRQLVRADGWDEAAHRHLMSALARSGHRGAALRHYDHVIAVLRRELGSAPARETVALYDQLRRGSVDG
jgi:DNA-binding SARP family transcriptional activator